MRRLRNTDGSPAHRRSARYHMSRCNNGEALHMTLRSEMADRYNNLKKKEREREDAEDAAVDTLAEAERAEERVENAVRDLDAAAASADRANPNLNVQKTIFPEGFGAVIDPDGRAQIAELEKLRVRVAPFKSIPGIAAALATLDSADAGLHTALDADDAADALVDKLFAEELSMRREVREQLESAYGRLRDHYKARPALAENQQLHLAAERRAVPAVVLAIHPLLTTGTSTRTGAQRPLKGR